MNVDFQVDFLLVQGQQAIDHSGPGGHNERHGKAIWHRSQ